MNYEVGPKELAHIFGFKDESWIHRLVKERGYPKAARGKYPLPLWVQRRELEFKEQVRDAQSKSLSQIDRRLQEIELEDAELDLAKKKGDLISVAEWLTVIDRIIVAVKRRMESQGSRLAEHLLNLTALSQPIKIINQDNHETLSELATGTYSPPASDLPTDEKTVQPNRQRVHADTKPHRKRVGRRIQTPKH